MALSNFTKRFLRKRIEELQAQRRVLIAQRDDLKAKFDNFVAAKNRIDSELTALQTDLAAG